MNHGRTKGLKVTSARHPSSLPTLSVRRGLRSSPVGLGTSTWLAQAEESRLLSTLQHLSMAQSAQHGATEGNDVWSYRASSAFHVHGCHVFEDRDLVQVLACKSFVKLRFRLGLCLCVSVSVCCVLCVVVVVDKGGAEEKGRVSWNHLVADSHQSFPQDC